MALGKGQPWTRVMQRHGRFIVLGAMVLVTLAFPRHGLGIYSLGVVTGAQLSLLAIAVVLAYRSDRIINFSQVGIVTAATALFTVLTSSEIVDGRSVGYFPLARLINGACPPCVAETVGGDQLFVLGRGAMIANYFGSAALTLIAAGLIGLIVHLMVHQLAQAPRLLVTIATLFVGDALTTLARQLPDWIITDDQYSGTIVLPVAPLPWEFTFAIGGVRLALISLVTVVAATLAVAAVAVYMTRSRSGMAIRAAAENPARAGSLGLNVAVIGRRVWLMCGLLGGLTGVLAAASAGITEDTNPAVLQVRILTAALVGGFTSVGVAGVAGVVVGMFEQAVQFNFSAPAVVDLGLLAVIALTLLLQRQKAARADAEGLTWRGDREIRPIPRELRGLPVVRSWSRGLAFGIAVVMLGLPWLLSASQTNLASVYLTYAIVAVSLLVLTGWAGQISLGQFAFAGVGAYVVALTGFPFLIALAMAAAAGGFAALLVGLPALRLRGLHLAVVTLAFAVAVSSFLLAPRYLGAHLQPTVQRPSLVGVSTESERVFYYMVLVVLVLVVAAVLGMRRSRTARMLIACRDNAQAAQSFGINLARARLSAFVAAGAIAAIGGALFAYSQQGVRPEAFSADQSVEIFLWTVIGGFGSVAGPLLGVAYFGFLALLGSNAIAVLLGGGFGSAGGFLLLLLATGGGLSQLVFRIRDNLLRRVAHRHGLVVPSLVADVRTEGRAEPTAPIAPQIGRTGGEVFVPRRYTLDGQWSVGQYVPTSNEPAVPAQATPARATAQAVDARPADARPADARPADARPADARPAEEGTHG